MKLLVTAEKSISVPAVKRIEPLHKPNDLWILSNFISADEEAALITVIQEYMPSESKILSGFC